jgi:probable lipoprotein NlpC
MTDKEFMTPVPPARSRRRFAAVVLALALALVSTTSPAPAAKKTAKGHRSVPHKTGTQRRTRHAGKLRAARPPVLDTTCLDTLGEVQRTLTEEINRWSSARYRHGGMSLRGIDCSGFTFRVFRDALNYTLPRTSGAQALVGETVGKDDLAFGDLLFFYAKSKGKRKRINHVGIYTGNGTFVHSHKHHGVGTNSLDDSYYARHFAFAKRVDPLALEVSGPESN